MRWLHSPWTAAIDAALLPLAALLWSAGIALQLAAPCVALLHGSLLAAPALIRLIAHPRALLYGDAQGTWLSICNHLLRALALFSFPLEVDLVCCWP